MVQPACLTALQELKTLPAPQTQLHLLKLLKNDIVGHGQRKELVVKHGLLDPLADLLLSTTKASGKKTFNHRFHESGDSTTPPHLPTLEVDIRLQATLIVGSLAGAGPAFVPPILATNLLPALLQALSPAEQSPKILIATLRSLNNLASAWASLAFTSPNATTSTFTNHILSKPAIDGLLAILRQPHAGSSLVHQQLALAAELITHCCVPDNAKNLMVKEGLLDALADLLASFAVSHAASAPSLASDQRVTVRNILNALSAIIEGSNYRSYRLIYSPSLQRVLATSKEHSYFNQTTGLAPNFQQHHRPNDVVPVENLLPKIMVQKSVSFASHHFPPVTLANSRLLAEQSAMDSPSPSPLCLWLIHLSRSQPTSSCRLATLRLLALVSNALDADAGGLRPELVPRFKERERQIALLAVPIAVKLVKDAADPKFGHNTYASEALPVKSEACAVLARLIKNNVELQKAAHSADAHKYIAKILRRSFDPVTLARPMWSPQNITSDPQSAASPSATLGDGGLPTEIVFALKCRAGALEAVAAISERDDAIRKDLIEAGVATQIIESLTPFPESAEFSSSPPGPKDGNTNAVIIAACQAATAMSRSVSNLRTSLIDAGLGKPVFALLTHPDSAVQIAATDVSINLVLEFSPMREDLISAGVIKIFCLHAKTSSSKLRQVSLWGLKHLVLGATQAIKNTCLEELGTGWLIQTIDGEQNESHAAPHLGMSSPNARGERIDLLNAPESPDMDIDAAENENSDDDNDDDDDDDEENEFSFDQNGTRYQSSGIRSTLESTSNKSRLRMFREQEFNPVYQAKQDDILTQEQALDFIRNLINGDDNILMIDHLNSTIGADRIFDMLYNKLKPAVAPTAPMHGFSILQKQQPMQSSTQTNNPTWQPPELVRAALGVLVHLAAGSPKHRQQLVAQKKLLTAWLPHFNHPDRQVRVSSVWGVINLTWPETSSDRDDARRRALELRSIGIEEKVRSLAHDADLDTRERVKTAVRQIDELLEGGRHR